MDVGKRRLKTGYKNIIKVILLCFTWVLMSAFTVPSYQPDQSIVDPLGYVNNEDRVRIYDAYQEVRNETGVRIVTVLSDEVVEGGVGSAVADVLHEWQLTRGVVVVINPVNNEVGFGVTKDIQDQIKDSGIVGDRLRSDVRSGNIVPGILFFYEDFPLDNVDLTQSTPNPVETVTYTEADVGDTTTIIEPVTLTKELSLVDKVMLGAVVIVLIGLLVYALHINKVNRDIEKDILVFIPYKIANEGNYSDKEIWNQLLEEGELQYEYSEYNKYLDSPHARRLSSTNDRFVQDDFNREQI